jgi:general secretion pathway protein M
MDTTLPTGRQGKLLASGLALIFLAALWLGAVAPLIAWYDARMDMLRQREAVARHMANVAEMLPVLQHQLVTDAAKLPSPDMLLAGASDPIAGAALQGLVQDFASQAGATLTSAEILPGQSVGSYRRIALRVSIGGVQWPVVVRLLRSIAQSTPRMLVDDLQLRTSPVNLPGQGTGQSGGPPPVGASFTIFAFRPGTTETRLP